MDHSVYQQFYKIEKDHWWFKGMRAICRRVLKRAKVNNDKTSRCLDIGCGTGLWTIELAEQGEVYGLDFSPEALSFCQKRGLKGLMRASAMSLPLIQDSFETITALGLIEHLDDDKGFLAELYRICAPGGYILILTSAYEVLWSRHDEIVHHKRRYTRRQLESLSAMSGFEIVYTSYVNTILFPPILAIRLFQWLVGASAEGGQGSPDLFLPRPLINKLLYGLLWTEARLLNFFAFPFGVGIVLLARRPLNQHPNE
jgi:ubiquinone/menaquinone biosynthesis C-methylase UbiE